MGDGYFRVHYTILFDFEYTEFFHNKELKRYINLAVIDLELAV